MPKVQTPEISEEDFPPDSSVQDRKHALALIGISDDKNKSLEEKLNIQHDNSAMLGDSKKKITTAERIHTLFKQQNFSPLTRLLTLVKIEEAKLAAYNRAVSYGMEPAQLKFLPEPDKKFYATLLLQLVKYEVPELKSVEVSGNVEMGMTVQVIHTAPQQKVVRVDANAPEKLKQLYGNTGTGLQTVAKEIVVELVDDI
jgi:hypothetical protein